MNREAILIERDGRKTIRFERRLQVGIERVWRAVTDPDEMRSWFPSAVVGERKVGATLRFPFDENVHEAFEGRVLEWDPMNVFAFSWNGDDLRIELSSDGDATNLVFTHALDDLTAAARTASGWEACLAGLDAHLGGPTPSPDIWKEYYPIYLGRMGPPLPDVRKQVSFTWERTHFVAPGRVWDCLTDPKELEGWVEAPVTVDLRLGGEIAFHFAPDDVVRCVIVALEDGHRIAYTFGDVSVVEWRVEKSDHGTRYWLSQHGLDMELAMRGAGWHAFLLSIDMYLSAGQPMAVEHEQYFDAFRAILP
jgi:uncharacterized protein YndB with AHSA1/START domain